MADSTVVAALKVLLQADTKEFDAKLKGADQNVVRLAERLKKDLEPNQRAVNKAVREFLGTREIGLAENYAKAVKEIGGASKLTAADQARVNTAVRDALGHYQALGQKAPAHLVALAKETKNAQQSTVGLNSALNSMKGVLGAFGVSVGVSGLVSFGRSIFENAEKIVDLSNKMGVGTEAAQRFRYAARQSGADIEDVSKSIVQMNDRLAEGNKSTVAALDAAGLKFDEIRNMKPEDAFRAISDAIAKIPDPMRQTQVAMELFGKAGANVLPMIRDGSLAAADAISVMADDTVKRLEEAKQAWENWGNTVVTETAEAAVAVQKFIQSILKPRGLDSFVTNFINAGLSTKDPNAALLIAIAKTQANEKAPDNVAASSFGMNKDVAAFVSRERERAAKANEKDDEEAQRRAKKAADDLREAVERLTGQKLRSDLKDFEQQFSAAMKAGGIHKTELDDTFKTIERFILAGEKISPSMMHWFTDAAMDRVIDRSNAIQTAILKTAISADALDLAQRKSLGGLVKPTDWAGIASGGMSVSGLMANVNTKGPGLGDAVKDQLRSSAEAFPDMLVKAIVHGRDISTAFHAIAVQFGSDIGASIGQDIAGKGGKMNQFLGGALGPLLGTGVDLLFKGVGKLFSSEGRKVNDLRDEFMEANGGYMAMQRTLAQFGNDPKLIGAFNRLYFTGKEGDFKKGMDAYEKRLAELQGAVAKGSELQAALQPFGGLLPGKAQGLLDSMLAGNVPGDLRTMLEGTRKPAWQTAAELAQAFGVDVTTLGRGFNQDRVASEAFTLKRAIDVFSKSDGADQDGFLRGLADELSKVASESQKNNVALPNAVKQFIQRVDAMGLLLDENGNRIDSTLLQFAEIEDENEKLVVSLLEQIRDILAGAGASAGTAVPTSPWDRLRARSDGGTHGWPGDSIQSEVGLPGFAGGTHGQFVDFGPGTPVMLHGRERVMTAVESERSGWFAEVKVPFNVDGRRLSEAIVRVSRRGGMTKV